MKTTKEQIKDGIEAAWRRGQLIKYAIGSVCMLATSIILTATKQTEDGGMNPVFLLLWLITAYYIGKAFLVFGEYRKLFFGLEQMSVREAVLQEPQYGNGRFGDRSLAVTLADEAGESIVCKTAVMWSNKMTSPYFFEDYLGKTVTLAYHAPTARVIILTVE